MTTSFIIDILYLIAALAFIIGLRRLSSPDTARKGNLLAAFAMGLAIVVSLFSPIVSGDNNYLWIAGGMIVGSLVGWRAAMKIAMTAMPQMVSVFNGFGGACAVLLGLIEVIKTYQGTQEMAMGEWSIVLFTLFVGAVSFIGSMLAFAKLDGRVDDKKVTFKGHSIVNNILLILVIVIGVLWLVMMPEYKVVFAIVFLAVSMIYGFSFVAPIGGADMPVVISLLNSFTGLTAAAAGLIYGNQLMLLGGILVGASGTILTVLMCQAMNRSLLNVIIGQFGGGGAAAKGQDGSQVVKEITISDAAILLFYSQSVVFVPGYGLAVAQAQKDCKELADHLEKNGVDVKYSIHPVAGRMPGHMNVLLAEADVPYPKLIDLETTNPQMPDTDAVIVVGANDVVNPAAQTDPSSPIYGMPVIEAWNAKNVIVMKRSMSAGYAGIQNALFFHERTKMLFGDAKDSMQKLIQEVKTL
jgi:NAD(P) transhydrogenase subunit beta